MSQSTAQHLDEHGYAVVRDFLDFSTTARLRKHMDAHLPAIERPELTVGKPIRMLRHPIPGAIMAEVITHRLLDLARELLLSTHIRLLEQVLIRTDPIPGPPGSFGWHLDQVFFPKHYHSVPRHTYYHFVHALNTVPAGGGAFTIVPGSHKKTYAATAKMSSVAEMRAFQPRAAELAGIDTKESIEVLAREGDLIVFNPMALHSASNNVTTQPRYVYFASFADVSADYLWNNIRETNYGPVFSDDLKNNLPPQWQDLLAGVRMNDAAAKTGPK